MVSFAVAYLPKLVLGVAGILGTVGAVKTLAAGGLKRKRKRKKPARRRPVRKAPKIRKRGRRKKR